MRRTFLSLLVAATVLLPTAAYAAEFRTGSTISLDRPSANDVFAAGSEITLKSDVAGEAFLAGTQVTTETTPLRSLFAAGSEVTVKNGAGYNLFAAGSTVTVSGTVANDAYIAGSNVTIDPSTVIEGDLRISAAHVTLGGTIRGNVVVNGAEVTSSAAIGGNFSGAIKTLAFTGGSIGGDLKYTSDIDATNLPSVGGMISRSPLPHDEPLNRIEDTLVALVASLILGAALIWKFPESAREATLRIQASYSRSLLVGIAALFVVPIAMIILVGLMVGWKLAVVIGLIYAVLLIVSSTIASLFVGRQLLVQLSPSMANTLRDQLIVGVIVVGIVSALPKIGGVAAMLFGAFAVLPALGSLIIGLSKRETAA